jgi:hypothetical protein
MHFSSHTSKAYKISWMNYCTLRLSCIHAIRIVRPYDAFFEGGEEHASDKAGHSTDTFCSIDHAAYTMRRRMLAEGIEAAGYNHGNKSTPFHNF